PAILRTSRVGPAARGPRKSLNAGAEPASTAVTEPNRSQSPRCPCKVPPNFTIPWSGSSPGGWLPSICRFGGRLVQKRWRNGEVGDAPKLTKWSRGHGRRRRRNVSRSRPPFSHRPAAAALIQLPPTTVARELARQLNHLLASATNE